MPELPEIEVLKRELEKEVVGRRMKNVVVRPGSNAMKAIRRHSKRKEFQDLLEGAKIDAVERVGRRLLLLLDNGHTMQVDLGPEGRLVKTSVSDELLPHTHIVIGFTIGGQARFIDPAKEGEVYVAPTGEIREAEDLRRHLIDPLEQQVAWQNLSELLEERDVPMKALLRDESFLPGLGDLYADEVLWAAGILPERSAARLTSQDVRRLYRALIEVLQDAVKGGGTTLPGEGFRGLGDQAGQFQNELKVFGLAGGSCRRCRNTIVVEDVAGYRTFFCPQCQS